MFLIITRDTMFFTAMKNILSKGNVVHIQNEEEIDVMLATKQLEQAQERIAEVSRIIKRLYEDNVNGKISDERFMELSADYEAEQAELKKRAAALQAELDKSQAATVNAEKFMGIVRKHLAFEELTPTLLREMVEKIVVHECSYDENGTRRQDIEIYYSFVGKIDLPE